MTPALFGLSGPVLTPDEAAFFREAEPAGYILFAANCIDRVQMRALTNSLRDLHGRDDVAILIDQEGGRVARMQAPEWPAFPAPAAFDALYQRAPITALEAARANAKALALMLRDVGITVNCLPLLDRRHPDTHMAIGDRTLGDDPLAIASLGRTVLDGLRSGGVVGVVKHMPGQGRATVDSHKALPHIRASDAALADDLFPFERLNDAPMGMTAHVVYPVWDDARCATLSPIIIADIIRERIGFDGFLMSDDLTMHALEGSHPARAIAAVAAGCDATLYCHGDIAEKQAVANALPDMTDRARARLAAAMASVDAPGNTRSDDGGEMSALIARRDALMRLA
jgi:beta-N-acetylhexosaminidase